MVDMGRALARYRNARDRLRFLAGLAPDEITLGPLEDRHRDRLVFPRITDNHLRDHMYRACRNARQRCLLSA